MITAEELSQDISNSEIWRADSVYGMAERLLPFIQSRAAGVQGAAYDRELIATMLHEGASVQKFAADAIREQIRLLRAADNADAAGVRTVSRPPKDAGAVPLPIMEVLDRRAVTPLCDHVVMGYTEAQLMAYGDAREAAANALIAECQPYLKDGETPVQRMERDHLESIAMMGLLAKAREAAGRADAVPDGYALVPAIPTEAMTDAYWRAVVLPDNARLSDRPKAVARWQAMLSAAPLPQHPPAEPAARAQVGDGACGYVNKDGTVTWYAENFGTVSCKPKPGAQIFTHPSPAHAGAGDAEALAQWMFDEGNRLAAEVGIRASTDTLEADPDMKRWLVKLSESIARRLAGGDHA